MIKTVYKRDGKKQKYDREKLKRSILRAFKSVDGEISSYAVDKANKAVEYIDKNYTGPIQTDELGKIVAHHLMSLKNKEYAEQYIATRNARQLYRGNVTDASVLSSLNVVGNKDYTVVGGYSNTGNPSSNNINWSIDSITGKCSFNNMGVSGGDYAELFKNGAGYEIPTGILVELNGDSVYPSNGNIFGVISQTYSILGNADESHWCDKYEKDDFGTIKMGYFVNRENKKVPMPLINKDYKEDKEYVPRIERPLEWSPVGLMGQVYVRIDNSDIKPNDYITAKKGIGTLSSNKTNCRVMKITLPYDAMKEYGVALCYLQGGI